MNRCFLHFLDLEMLSQRPKVQCYVLSLVQGRHNISQHGPKNRVIGAEKGIELQMNIHLKSYPTYLSRLGLKPCSW